MGGPGSGNCYRWNTKAEAESFQRLDVRDKSLKKCLKPGLSLRFRYSHQNQEISLELCFDWTPCNYGGQRAWFKCPRCWRRVAVLYFIGRSFICRHCAGLTYRSQNENQFLRASRRADKIMERLGDEPDNSTIPSRPKGMHQKTYERLIERWYRANQEAWELIERVIGEAPEKSEEPI
jgi:hypothetical protein